MRTFDYLQLTAVVLSLMFVGYQVRLQRITLDNQIRVQGFQLYHLLAQQYIDLLLRADQDPVLNSIWESPNSQRKRELDDAQESRRWGAWFVMTPEEKRCYRYTRSAIETFEQTYQVYQRGWIDPETWAKWQAWMTIWKDVWYFDYVFSDTRPRLIKDFALKFDSLATWPEGEVSSQ